MLSAQIKHNCNTDSTFAWINSVETGKVRRLSLKKMGALLSFCISSRKTERRQAASLFFLGGAHPKAEQVQKAQRAKIKGKIMGFSQPIHRWHLPLLNKKCEHKLP